MPDILIYLQCPGCGFVWHAATMATRWWWARDPKQIERECYCPECDHKPPMKRVPLE